MEKTMYRGFWVRVGRGLSLGALLGAMAVGCTLVVDNQLSESVCGDGVVDGDEECDDGDPSGFDGCDDTCRIALPCSSASECVADDLCLGTGQCIVVGDGDTTGCAWPAPVDCDDSSPCTADSCDSATGSCLNTLIDEDGDLHASDALGACGSDCDDTDPEIHDDYPEVCNDGKDNNCSGDQTDEMDVTWYADCDADGYAVLGAEQQVNCAKPVAAPAGCPAPAVADWTVLNPATSVATRDCADLAPNAFPGQTDWFTNTVNVEGGYDYDCSTEEEKRWTTVACTGTLCIAVCSSFFCRGDPCDCSRGWDGAAPACSMNGTWLTCGDDSPGCPSEITREQECH